MTQNSLSNGIKKDFTTALKSGSGVIACYEELFDASRIALFGFDTASRRYGLVETVEAICSIDSEVSENPIGEIYEKLEPDATKRRELVEEMRKISLDSCEYPYDVKVGTVPKLDVDSSGEVKEKGVSSLSSRSRWRSRGEAPEIIAAFKYFISELEKDPRYEELAQEAKRKDLSVVAYLATGTRTPSLSRLFLKVESELAAQAKINMRTLVADGINIAEKTGKIRQSIKDKYEEELEKYAEIKQTLELKLRDITYDDMRHILEDALDRVNKLTAKKHSDIAEEIDMETKKYLRSVDCSEDMLEWIQKNKKHLDKIVDDLDYIAKRR